MGLAATQVRILSLTSRQHMIEYKAQRLQAQKLQLANESDAAYNTYMEALDATKVQYKYVEGTGSITYKDANFKNMFTYGNGVQSQYVLLDAKSGKIILPDSIKSSEAYNGGTTVAANSSVPALYNAIHGDESSLTAENINTILGAGTITPDTTVTLHFPTTISDSDRKAYQEKAAAVKFADAVVGSSSTDTTQKSYYKNLYVKINSVGYLDPSSDIATAANTNKDTNSVWLTNMIKNGSVLLSKWDEAGGDNATGAWTDVSVSTDTTLQEVSDDTSVKKAEATYEAETTRINKKDSQYDTMLSQTETERSAIKTEMDSLKQVRNDNIDKNFKLFS